MIPSAAHLVPLFTERMSHLDTIKVGEGLRRAARGPRSVVNEMKKNKESEQGGYASRYASSSVLSLDDFASRE
jgi:hypothetical protein